MDGTLATPAGEALWAHPVALLALPAFIPVVVIVVTILWIARNDRRAEAAELAADEGVVDDGRAVPSTAEPVVAAARPAPPAVESAPASAEGEPPEPRRTWRDRRPRLVIGDED